MKLGNLLSGAAAASLVLAPISAHAGTLASVPDGVGAAVKSNFGSGSSKRVTRKSDSISEELTIGVLLALAVVLGAAGASGGGGSSSSRSPGAN